MIVSVQECPNCGRKLQVSTGHAIRNGKIHWWRSCRCETGRAHAKRDPSCGRHVDASSRRPGIRHPSVGRDEAGHAPRDARHSATSSDSSYVRSDWDTCRDGMASATTASQGYCGLCGFAVASFVSQRVIPDRCAAALVRRNTASGKGVVGLGEGTLAPDGPFRRGTHRCLFTADSTRFHKCSVPLWTR
jgi:hypothetical protein